LCVLHCSLHVLQTEPSALCHKRHADKN
jgi:hypothetical protein